MINTQSDPPQPLLPTEEASNSRTGGVCSAFAKGSRWGTVTNLCAAIMGAGCLSLPKAVSDLGLVPFAVLIVLTGIATHYSIVLLVDAIDATGCRSFEDLTARVIGSRTGHLVEFSIIVFQYGTLVAYTIAIGDILQPILELDSVRVAAPWLSRQLIMVGFWAVFMLPLSFVERMSDLQITSLLGQLSLLYLVLAVSAHSLLDVRHRSARTALRPPLLRLLAPACAPHPCAAAALGRSSRRRTRTRARTRSATSRSSTPASPPSRRRRSSCSPSRARSTCPRSTTSSRCAPPRRWAPCRCAPPPSTLPSRRRRRLSSSISLTALSSSTPPPSPPPPPSPLAQVRAVLVCMVCYCLIGIFGYADFPLTTQPNILSNFCLLDPEASARRAPEPRLILSAGLAPRPAVRAVSARHAAAAHPFGPRVGAARPSGRSRSPS